MLPSQPDRARAKGKRGGRVPLSEDEQRILSEIEAKLYESDPALARDIADTTIYTHAYRNLKWALLGFVARPRHARAHALGALRTCSPSAAS